MKQWNEDIINLKDEAYTMWEYQSKYNQKWYPMTKRMFNDRTAERKKYCHLPEQILVRRIA